MLLVGCCLALLMAGAADAGGAARPVAQAGAPAADQASPIAAQGVRYARGRDLDVYRPPRPVARTPAPVVVILHACCGDRSDLGKLAEAVAAGAVVFNADWSGMDADARYPAAYEEAACAVRYARAAAPRYGGDPRRLALLGWSDGALVASVVALAGDRLGRSRCVESAESAVPAALVGVGGYYGWRLPVPPTVVTPRAVRFLGGTPGTAASSWRAATPYSWLGDRGPIRTTLLVGSTDPLRADALRFAQALQLAGRPVRVVVAPPAGDQSMISPRTAEGRTTVREALAAAVRGSPPCHSQPYVRQPTQPPL